MNDAFRKKLTEIISHGSRHTLDVFKMEPFRIMATHDPLVKGMLELLDSGQVDWMYFLIEMAVRQTAMRILVQNNLDDIKARLTSSIGDGKSHGVFGGGGE